MNLGMFDLTLLTATAATLNPLLLYALTAGAVWLLVYLWRRFAPGLWELATKRNPKIEMLPALILSALITAAPDVYDWRGFLVVVQDVGVSIVIGFLAIGTHHALKAAPGPYTGGAPKPPGG